MIRYTNSWFSVVEEDSYFRISNHLAQVVVLPVVAGTDVVMVKVKRPLFGDSVWELPAGAIETGETPLDGAKREMREETGIDSTPDIRWTRRGQLAVMPNRMSELAHVFRADLDESTWDSRREHDDEIASVERWSFDEVVKRVAQRDLFVTLPMAVVLREQALGLL